MNKKTYILLGLSLFLVTILSGIIWYGISSLISLKNEEGVLRGEMQSWIKRSKQTASLQNTLKEAKEAKISMDQFYFDPTEENQISLISDLERIIKETDSAGEVKSLDVLPDNSKVIGSVIITGEWNNVYHTLLALETYPIKLNFDDVTVNEDTSVDPNVAPTSVKKIKYRAIVRFTIKNIRNSK